MDDPASYGAKNRSHRPKWMSDSHERALWQNSNPSIAHLKAGIEVKVHKVTIR